MEGVGLLNIPHNGSDDDGVFLHSRTVRMSSTRRIASRAAPLIRIIGVDRAMFDLLTEWLTAEGYAVANGSTDDHAKRAPAAVAIVDIPYARQGGRDAVQRVAAQYPGIRILALSATFFSNVRCGGNCANALGADGVLPKPVARDDLIAAIRNLVHSRT
jgi:DNA-binding NarL/FixJ family response regulator